MPSSSGSTITSAKLNGMPQSVAVAAVKEVTRATEGLPLAECYALLRSGTLAAYEQMLNSQDAVEGPRAFAEKRAPMWQGK